MRNALGGGAEHQRGGDGGRAERRRGEQGGRDHPEADEASPEAKQQFSGRRHRSDTRDEIRRVRRIRDMDRARPVQVILHAEIDDEARPDRERGDEEDSDAPVRRVGDGERRTGAANRAR